MPLLPDAFRWEALLRGLLAAMELERLEDRSAASAGRAGPSVECLAAALQEMQARGVVLRADGEANRGAVLGAEWVERVRALTVKAIAGMDPSSEPGRKATEAGKWVLDATEM